MFIGNGCYFCLNKVARVTVDDHGEELKLCPSCYKQFMEAADNVDKNPMELPRKNPSDVCVKCGLCCIVLNAKVGKVETEKLLEQARDHMRHPKDITFEQFCSLQEYPPYRGEYTINMPCRYLQGRMLEYVSCRVYDLDRPKVCGSYLCKVAVEYRLGKISLPEALFRLRGSFMQGDVTIFNWTQGKEYDDHEKSISILGQLSDLIHALRKEDIPEDQIEFAVANRLTPGYLPSSSVARSFLNMHLYNVDRGEFNLELYIPDLIKEFNEEQKAAATATLMAVLTDIRSLFIREDEVGTASKEPTTEEDNSPAEITNLTSVPSAVFTEEDVGPMEELVREGRAELLHSDRAEDNGTFVITDITEEEELLLCSHCGHTRTKTPCESCDSEEPCERPLVGGRR